MLASLECLVLIPGISVWEKFGNEWAAGDLRLQISSTTEGIEFPSMYDNNKLVYT